MASVIKVKATKATKAKAPTFEEKTLDDEALMHEQHRDMILSDVAYLSNIVFGLAHRSTCFQNTVYLSGLQIALDTISEIAPSTPLDLTKASLQWAIDTIGDSGVGKLAPSLAPVLDALVFTPAIKELMSTKNPVDIAVEVDSLYYAVVAHLQDVARRTPYEATQLVNLYKRDIYAAAAKLFPLPEQPNGCLNQLVGE